MNSPISLPFDGGLEKIEWSWYDSYKWIFFANLIEQIIISERFEWSVAKIDFYSEQCDFELKVQGDADLIKKLIFKYPRTAQNAIGAQFVIEDLLLFVNSKKFRKEKCRIESGIETFIEILQIDAVKIFFLEYCDYSIKKE